MYGSCSSFFFFGDSNPKIVGFRSSPPSHITSVRPWLGPDSRTTFGDSCDSLHGTTKKLTDRQSRVGRPLVTPTTGIDHGWVQVSHFLMILPGFVSFRLTPVGSRVGNKRRCVDTGTLCVTHTLSLLQVSDPGRSSPRISKDRSRQMRSKGWMSTTSYRGYGTGGTYLTRRLN